MSHILSIYLSANAFQHSVVPVQLVTHKQGFRVTLIEQEHEWGGTSACMEEHGLGIWDAHQNAYAVHRNTAWRDRSLTSWMCSCMPTPLVPPASAMCTEDWCGSP